LPGEKELKEKLKEHRLTPQRRHIFALFLENKEKHLSAEDVYRLLQEKDRQVGLATVYRTLDLLVELGLLQKHHFGDGRSRYERVQSSMEHRHHHLVCLKCQGIYEVKEDLLCHLERQIASEHKFEIVDHHLQFFGYCAKCSAKSRQKKKEDNNPQGG
jgi:Fur family ferric uptake transcriptional regulator